MSNERYLIVSYFFFAFLCLGMGVLAYWILRRPFERIAEATVGSRSPVLKRVLAISMTAAGALGFLGFSYNQKGCTSYEQVISNRYFLVEANVEQDIQVEIEKAVSKTDVPGADTLLPSLHQLVDVVENLVLGFKPFLEGHTPGGWPISLRRLGKTRGAGPSFAFFAKGGDPSDRTVGFRRLDHSSRESPRGFVFQHCSKSIDLRPRRARR